MTDNFVWYELCTNDIEGAKAFYGKLLGWTATRFQGEGAGDYDTARRGPEHGLCLWFSVSGEHAPRRTQENRCANPSNICKSPCVGAA